MGKNVLIVDDSATTRKSIMRGIQKAGIGEPAFTEAGDGNAGLQAVLAAKFDLILADVDMPNMNGLDFVTAVREQDPAAPPIVMIAGAGSEDVIVEAMRRGANGCLDKPISPQGIRQVLGPWLQ
jgi:two-component system chemotaxis response regulator CheY